MTDRKKSAQNCQYNLRVCFGVRSGTLEGLCTYLSTWRAGWKMLLIDMGDRLAALRTQSCAYVFRVTVRFIRPYGKLELTGWKATKRKAEKETGGSWWGNNTVPKRDGTTHCCYKCRESTFNI